MKPTFGRIERFIEQAEAALNPPTDHRRWIRLLDPEDGETDEAAIAAHLAAHPEDGERLHWLQWIRTGVPRVRDPVAERSSDYQLPTEASPEIVAETKPVASPTPEPKKPEIKAEPELELEPIVPWGFGRKVYDPFNDVYRKQWPTITRDNSASRC
jgi:hypothetical protein